VVKAVLCGAGPGLAVGLGVVSVGHPLLEVCPSVEHTPAEAESVRPYAQVSPIPQGGDGRAEERSRLIKSQQDRLGGVGTGGITHGQAPLEVNGVASTLPTRPPVRLQ
jgi:hypothetical protein